jgi:hypothetical protein
MSIPFAIARATVVLSLCGAVSASAQTLPAGPARAFDGRLVASGEVSATFGAADDEAYFNFTDYEHNALRVFRLALSAAWRPAERIALVGELRSEDLDEIRPYAAYIRVRPWRNRAFDVQAGRIPPTFGAFGRRTYGVDNPLIGYPLAYQYLISLRADAVPASADDLLRMRARGWRPSFPIGAHHEAPGLPLVSAFRWDVGVQARWSEGPLELATSITNGTLSNPRLSDDNGGKQISGRAAVRPVVGLVIGASASRGAWLSRGVTASAPDRSYSQRAFGADAEYSRDHWLVRGELVWSAWDLPFLEAGDSSPVVSATSAWLEGRYRLTPRLFVAARGDRIGFSRITGSAVFPGTPTPWDAPVERVEAAAGYYLQRNLIAQWAVQRNAREAGRVRRRTYLAGQLTYWF